MILVTGFPRTGTTTVARVLHHLGCPMGQSMRMPLPAPGCDYDFEDVTAVDHLLRHERLSEWWPDYEWHRRDQHRIMSDAGFLLSQHWGVKSPFFLPHVETLRRVASEPVYVVLCVRSTSAIGRSLSKQFQGIGSADTYAKALTELGRLMGHEVLRPDLVVNFDEMRADDAIAHDLASLCGSKEDAKQVYLEVAKHWSH